MYVSWKWKGQRLMAKYIQVSFVQGYHSFSFILLSVLAAWRKCVTYCLVGLVQ